MEIRFDPLNEREAEAVARWLNLHGALAPRGTWVQSTCGQDGPHITPLEDFGTAGVMVGDIPLDDFHKALCEEKLKNAQQAEADRQSATGFTPLPLDPDAPLAAAADLFPSAPAAAPAGQASETPVPPPPAVPAPPQAAAPSAPAGAMNPADVDKHGLPWDARIHSGTKAVNADGSWRQRRGLNDPELVKRVEAELRALMAVPVSASPLALAPFVENGATVSTNSGDSLTLATSVTGRVEPAPVVPPPPVSAPVPNVPPPPVVPVPPSSVPATAPIPSPPAVPAPPTVAAPAAPITFADVMRKVTSNIASAKITEAEVHAGLTSIGLAAGEIGKMNGRPDLIKQMSDYLDQLLISKAGV